MGLYQKLLSFLEGKLGPGSFAYAIMKPCHRCVYGKRREPIIILSSRERELGLVKIVVNLREKTYARRGGCLGFKVCGLCIEKIENPDLKIYDKLEIPIPCVWYKI